MEIKGFSNYTIDYNGNVYSKFKKRFLKPRVNREGYLRIGLHSKFGNKDMLIHRIMGIQFLPNYYGKKEIDHIDGNPKNNKLFNLRWATRSENEINKPLSIKNKLGYRHINLKYNHTTVYCLSIKRNHKMIFRRSFSIKKYTLEEVVKIRNEIYKEFNIKIND